MPFTDITRRLAYLLILLVLAACNLPGVTGDSAPPEDQGVQPSPTPPPLEQEQTATPMPPTETPSPAPPTETPLPTATEGPNFAEASIYAVGHLGGNRLLVTVQIPGGVEGSFRSTVATTSQTCEILAEYPDRLYCTGPEPFENYSLVSANFRLYPVGQSQPVFETEFNIPPRPTPTPTPSNTPTPTYTPTP